MAAACRWPSPSKAPMCLTRNWLPPHSTPSRSSAPIPLPKSRSIFASIKAIPANRLTAKPANAAIRLTFPARPTKSQSRSTVGSLGGGKLNALIPGSTAPGGYSSAGKKRSPITWASCIFNSPSSLYEPRRFSDRLLIARMGLDGRFARFGALQRGLGNDLRRDKSLFLLFHDLGSCKSQ